MELMMRACTLDDLHALHEFSYRTFRETFSHMNTPASMKAYLDKAFDPHKIRDELSNGGSSFYFLYADGELAGYLKLNESAAQTDLHDPLSVEIERIYVAKEFQGKGLGKVLLNKAADVAAGRGKSYLWLGVWEKNEKAILFYQKNGFLKSGTHSFFMGEEEQTDFIMRKEMPSA